MLKLQQDSTTWIKVDKMKNAVTCCQGCGTRRTLSCHGSIVWHNFLWKLFGSKYFSILWPTNCTPRCLSKKKRDYVHKNVCTLMCLVMCFITGKKLETAQVSLNKRMGYFFYLWHIPTVENHWAIKKNRLLILITTEINFKNSMSKRSQTLKDTYLWSGEIDVC